MEVEPLLNVEPPELVFQLELNKQLSSSIRLLNKTDNCAAFKLLSTNPRNYVVRPRIGILLPEATCEIIVTTTRALREAPHNMKCKDKFMIRTRVAAPGATLDDARKMFDKEGGHVFQESKLRVVYSRPTESSSETSDIENPDSHVPEGTNSVMEPHHNDSQFDTVTTSIEECELQVVCISEQENNNNHIAELVLRGIISCLLALLSLYIMKQTLSWMWSLAMIAIMLMIKMIKKLVSDSVEDWVVKTLLYIFMHILFGRKAT